MDAAPSRRRDRTKSQNRETILAAARTVFAQHGFASVTVRDIIRATPLASGTFYNYFKSKEQVYQALRDEEALAVRPRLRQARDAAGTAEEFIAANFRAPFPNISHSVLTKTKKNVTFIFLQCFLHHDVRLFKIFERWLLWCNISIRTPIIF